MNPFDDIREFHEKFGLAYDGPIRALPNELDEFRHRFGLEELNEWLESNKKAQSSEPGDQADYSFHLNNSLDALVDQMYVLMGTIYLQGMDNVFEEAWDRVHEKNMMKVRAEKESDSKRGSTFDVVKPQGWTPPDHSDLVEVNDRS